MAIQENISAFELAFFRSFFNFAVSSTYLIIARQSLGEKIDASNRSVLLIRCLSGSICFLCFVTAIKYIPLSIYFVVMNAGPFFIALLACLWLKERITLFEVFAMLGAFGGIIMVGLSKSVASDDSKTVVEDVVESEEEKATKMY